MSCPGEVVKSSAASAVMIINYACVSRKVFVAERVMCCWSLLLVKGKSLNNIMSETYANALQ